jgi:hypothetical protein
LVRPVITAVLVEPDDVITTELPVTAGVVVTV